MISKKEKKKKLFFSCTQFSFVFYTYRYLSVVRVYINRKITKNKSPIAKPFKYIKWDIVSFYVQCSSSCSTQQIVGGRKSFFWIAVCIEVYLHASGSWMNIFFLLLLHHFLLKFYFEGIKEEKFSFHLICSFGV